LAWGLRGWPVPMWIEEVLPSMGPSEDELAWRAACDAIRARLKYPAEARFPEMPAVKDCTDTETYSYSNVWNHYFLLEINASNRDLEKDRADEYFAWRAKVLSRVEMTKDWMNQDHEEKGWVAAGWVETSNAMGVRETIPWIAELARYDETKAPLLSRAKLIDIQD